MRLKRIDRLLFKLIGRLSMNQKNLNYEIETKADAPVRVVQACIYESKESQL